MKTLLKILGGLVVLLVLAALVVPFVVDVNKYRPVIIQKANERINGKLDIGQIKLSLWGAVSLDIDGVTLDDARGTRVLQVKDASLEIPFLSFLSGSPVVRIVMDSPTINVVKGRDGKINLLTLMKPTAEAGGQAPAGAGQPGGAPAGQTEVPAMVLNSRVTVLIDHAKVAYKDELAGATYNISDLSFHVQDVSPSSRMPFDAEAILDMTLAQNMRVKGPLKIDGALQAVGKPNPFDQINGALNVVLDDLEIEKPGVISKKKGVVLRMESKGETTKDELRLNEMKLRLADVSLSGRANAKMQGETTVVDGEIQSNQIDLAKLGALFPQISENNVNGVIILKAKASGPTTALAVSADVTFDNVQLKTEAMSKPVIMYGSLQASASELKNLSMRFQGEGLSGTLDGTASAFTTAPRFRFTLKAKEMDLDKLMPNSAAAKAANAPAGSGAGGSAPPAGKTADVDYNAMFEPLRTNPLAARSAGSFDFEIASFKSAGMPLKNVKGQFALNNLVMQLKGFSFNAFDGTFKTDGSIDAKSAKPQVAINTEIAGMKTEKMVEAKMSFAKNTVKGIVSGKINIGGTGLNRPEINSNWKGGGSFSITDARFSSLDIGKQIKEGLMSKLPEIAKSRIKISDKLENWHGEYQLIETKFALNNGTLTLSDLTGKAIPNNGLDLKGAGTVKITDYGMDVNADFIDRYGMLGPGFPKDQRYGVAAISARITGSMFGPKFDWGYTVQQFAKNTAKDVVKEKGMEEAKKQLQNMKVPEEAKGILKGIFR